MITYCSKCNINWAKLWSQDVEDTTVEVCPICKSDRHLEDATDIISFTKCPFTGLIKNVLTDDLLPTVQTKKQSTTRKVKVWEESYEEFKERQDKAQYDLINRYAELKLSMGDSAAYHQACTEMEKVERKFHFEETTIF